MWFKNLTIFRLAKNYGLTAQALDAFLRRQTFTECGTNDIETSGFVEPINCSSNGFLHSVNRQYLMKFMTAKKLLPASVINEVAKAKAKELEEEQGFAPGRKAMKELKERITDELLPRAFTIHTPTNIWIDPVNGWLVMDTASPNKADDILKALLKSIDTFAVEAVRLRLEPKIAMTDWLCNDEAPKGFTIDQDTELRAYTEDKATVKYVRQSINADDVQSHVAAGKQCTKLAMTWNDKISFVLTEQFLLRRIKPLDVLTEEKAVQQDEIERFESDFMLMTGEINALLSSLIEAIGGEMDQKDIVNESASQIWPDKEDAVEVSDDELYRQAEKIVTGHQRASISLIQRHLRIGYNRAARLVDAMEERGVVGPMQANGGREVLKAAA